MNRDRRSRSRLRQAGRLAAAVAGTALLAAACSGSPHTAETGTRSVMAAQRIKVLTRALMLMQKDYGRLHESPGPQDVLD